MAAIQSSYIPWRGYFDFIESADVFVIYDDVQYSTGSWRNRNKIKTPQGAKWLTVPVNRKNLSELILDVKIDYSRPWQEQHLQAWAANYITAPYYNISRELLASAEGKQISTISQLNIHFIRKICEFLDIATPLIPSTELELQGSKTTRLIDMLKKLGATTYLSGPSADGYLDKEAFQKNGIQLEYKAYDYVPYPQLWGDFIGEVTVLDLIANCGSDAKNYIRSQTPDRIVLAK